VNKNVIRRSVVLLLLAMLAGCDATPSAPSRSGQQNLPGEEGVVQLKIDFLGRKANIQIAVPCQPPMTVFGVLENARDRGDLTFESTGRGETAFVSAIGGIENEGAAGDNWVFHVNEQLGDRGSGVFEVNTGDQVLWTFGKYSPSSSSAD
jgi:hypothetical protein